jgi:hypothetical protein
MSNFVNNDLMNQVTIKNTFVHVNSFAEQATTDGSSCGSPETSSSQSSPGGTIAQDSLYPPQLSLGRSSSAPTQQTVDQIQYEQPQMAAVENSYPALSCSEAPVMDQNNNFLQAQSDTHDSQSSCSYQTGELFTQNQYQQPQQQQQQQQFAQSQYMQQMQQQQFQPMQHSTFPQMSMPQMNMGMTSSPNANVIYVQAPQTSSPQLAQNWNAVPMFAHSGSVDSNGSMMASPSQQPMSSVPVLVNPQGVQNQMQMQQGMVSPMMPVDMNELPSIGSAGHAFGTCKRCCFHPKGRCVNGAACLFCHFPHEKRIRRSKKAKRSRTGTSSMTEVSTGSPGTYDYSLSQMTDGSFQVQPQPMQMMTAPQMQCMSAPVSPQMDMMQGSMQGSACPSPAMQPVMQNPNQLQF